ncbi:hypothetical protein SAMN02746062_01507 [Alysiella filiformis DSM 16848]|uniref:Uncharacterized protein n=2 Tax=Alysiella TaxID=194195 RepID=A0A286EDS3_9NEIS|nr:hypothetical protein SAMN02746062_01507 [Alysiella filiformis DSM 16848]
MASLWCASPAALAAEPSTSPYQNCQNLKKIKDIDDLLYQMHSNLDGDCLFKIPSKKLAKIWGIPIFDETDYPDGQKHRQAIDKYQLHAKKPSLYVKKWGTGIARSMSIDSNKALIRKTINSQNVLKGFDGNLGQGKLPKYLPSPNVAVPLIKENFEDHFYQQGYVIPHTEYQSHFIYCWFNQDDYFRDKPYYYISVLTARSGIDYITLSNARHLFQTQCKQNPLYYLPQQGK